MQKNTKSKTYPPPRTHGTLEKSSIVPFTKNSEETRPSDDKSDAVGEKEPKNHPGFTGISGASMLYLYRSKRKKKPLKASFSFRG